MKEATQWLQEQADVEDLAIFLDFDGTLAPIVERPGDARPVEGVAPLIERIAEWLPVAIISGRGLDDISDRLGAEGIHYAGSHGMEIRGPHGEHHEFEELTELLPELDRREARLREELSDVAGVEVERKRFGIALHYRRNPKARPTVEEVAAEAADASPRLKVSTGKKLRELQPDVELDKGTALRYILDRVDPEGRRRPLYIGDDRTDEDAFAVIGDEGIPIVVGDEGRETLAKYRLRDPEAVRNFLERLANRLA